MKKQKRLRLLTLSSLFISTAVMAENICSTAEDCFAKADQAIINQQFKQAFSYATVSCDKGYADGCSAVGVLYQRGFGVEQDFEKSNEALEKACKLGSGDGCATLASTYFSGRLGVPQNESKAVAMATIGCDNDNALSCLLLGAAQIQGRGTEKAIDNGNASLDKACRLDSDIVCPRAEQVREALLKN